MSSVQNDVEIILSAEDRASPVVDAAAKRINSSWNQMRNQQRAVTRAFELQHRTFTQTARVIQQVGNVANRVIGLYQAYTLQQIRINDLTREAAQLQREYNKAIAEGNFEEAVEIEERKKEVVEETNRALQDQIFLYVTTGVTAAGMASQLTKNVLPAILRIRGGFRSANIEIEKFRQTTLDESGTKTTTKSSSTTKTTTKSPTKGPRIGISGKIGFGALGILAGGIAEQVLNSPDPIDTLKQFILDPLNFNKSNDQPNKIIVTVNVNGTEQRAEIIQDPITGQLTYGGSAVS